MSAYVDIIDPRRVWRFWAKVAVGFEDECWRWLGAPDRKGYGQFRVSTKTVSKAHIYSYVLHFGYIEKGLQVDHTCDHAWCVNPAHLRLLTNAQNNARSNSPSAINMRKTHCVHGHEFTSENTYTTKLGYRRCRMCIAERERRVAA